MLQGAAFKFIYIGYSGLPKTIANVCSQHILIFLFRIENNTWVHIDMDFLLPGLVILLKHFSLFYVVKEFSLPLRI